MELSDKDIWVSHINYELSTLIELPKWVGQFSDQGPLILQNACLESALIHARLLIEFLVGRPGTDGSRRRFGGDIRPDDFLTGWQHPNPTCFDDRLRAIDRHLAHLSRDRADGDTAPNNFLTDLVDDVLQGFVDFATEVASTNSEQGTTIQTVVNHAMTIRLKDQTR